MTKATANFFTCGCPTLVFYSIMEQGSNGFVFVSAVFKYDTGNTEQVRDIWNRRPFAHLLSMEARRKNEGLFKTG
jgi:hypothetical protein